LFLIELFEVFCYFLSGNTVDFLIDSLFNPPYCNLSYMLFISWVSNYQTGRIIMIGCPIIASRRLSASFDCLTGAVPDSFVPHLAALQPNVLFYFINLFIQFCHRPKAPQSVLKAAQRRHSAIQMANCPELLLSFQMAPCPVVLATPRWLLTDGTFYQASRRLPEGATERPDGRPKAPQSVLTAAQRRHRASRWLN
jgi:hypothetical protein